MRRTSVLLALHLCTPGGSWTPPPRRAALRPPAARRRAAAAVASAEATSFDVAVVGGGPAGYAAAALLAREQLSVALIDPSPERAWPNNYGSWRVEWEALAARLQMPELLECVNTDWAVTDCYFGGSFDMPSEQRLRLDRAYLQVDRTKLKACLQARHADGGVQLLRGSVPASAVGPNLFDDGSLVHDARGSTIRLSPGGEAVRARLVVDATGFESKLSVRESAEAAGLWKEQTPGYQIAYGMTIDLREGATLAPYASEAMTLFDYRTDHLEGTPLLDDALGRPSFVYVMPESPSTAFFEETRCACAYTHAVHVHDVHRLMCMACAWAASSSRGSLVGRDERRLEFETLKARLLARLAFHGIAYDEASVREEEYCYIPMGGALPDPAQRVVPFGGAANTVHPATGYQLCRMLASTTDLAGALGPELRKAEGAVPSHTRRATPSASGAPCAIQRDCIVRAAGADADVAAAAAHAALWTRANRLQRDFAVFGGEFLGAQPVEVRVPRPRPRAHAEPPVPTSPSPCARGLARRPTDHVACWRQVLRGFFDAFFALEPQVGHGALAGWPMHAHAHMSILTCTWTCTWCACLTWTWTWTWT